MSPEENLNPIFIPQYNIIPSLVKLNPLLTLGLCGVNEKAPSILRQPSFFVVAIDPHGIDFLGSFPIPDEKELQHRSG